MVKGLGGQRVGKGMQVRADVSQVVAELDLADYRRGNCRQPHHGVNHTSQTRCALLPVECLQPP